MNRFLLVEYFLHCARVQTILEQQWIYACESLNEVYMLFNAEDVDRLIAMAIESEGYTMKEILDAAGEAQQMVLEQAVA